jgi:heat shock protein HtpX
VLAAYGLRTHIWNNRLKSAILLAGFPFLLLLICDAFALIITAFDNPNVGEGFVSAFALLPTLIPIALIGAAIWFAIAWFAHQGIIDAATGAHKVDRNAEPRLWNLLENLCISRGITVPDLRVIETDQRNAYASGVREKHYAITVTRGLIDSLDDAELEAVLAHELTHIRNRDVQLLVISAVFVGVITLAADLLVRSPRLLLHSSRGMARGSGRGKGGGGALVLILVAVAIFILARVLAIGLRFAISRRREYLADAGSVELTKNADAMIGALRKIEGHSEVAAPSQIREMFLDLPHAGGLSGIFATHPSIDDRVAALVRFGGGREPIAREPPAIAPPATEMPELAEPGSPIDEASGPWGEAPDASEPVIRPPERPLRGPWE